MACFLSRPVHLEGGRNRGWKEVVGRGKNASYSFRTGPTPCAYRADYRPVVPESSCCGLRGGNSERRYGVGEGAPVLSTWALWSTLLHLWMQTHRGFSGPRPWPLEPIHGESGFYLTSHSDPGDGGSKGDRRKGEAFEQMEPSGEKCTFQY